ncbi:Uncharacterised protein [Salmonella enterica subsp. enterica]|nr:Uncharacterised protein [Salmonella enterica subsp. enterica]
MLQPKRTKFRKMHKAATVVWLQARMLASAASA